MPESLLDTKQRIRTELRASLRALGSGLIESWSAGIVRHLTAPGVIEPAQATVALFSGIPGEPDLLPLIPWVRSRGGRAVFFGFAEGQLVPCLVKDTSELERGLFGVWVPRASCPVLPAEELDVILTPGLAFDRQGGRLGRGRGHFDRLFAQAGVKARRVGVCFDCQVIDQVPVEAHDARMDVVVTERG